MRNGPKIQVIRKETTSNLGFANTFGICENFTFVNGGYIIKIKPIANGILVVPFENEFIKSSADGIKYPIAIPTPIARKIQIVRYLSKKLNFFFIEL